MKHTCANCHLTSFKGSHSITKVRRTSAFSKVHQRVITNCLKTYIFSCTQTQVLKFRSLGGRYVKKVHSYWSWLGSNTERLPQSRDGTLVCTASQETTTLNSIIQFLVDLNAGGRFFPYSIIYKPQQYTNPVLSRNY